MGKRKATRFPGWRPTTEPCHDVRDEAPALRSEPRARNVRAADYLSLREQLRRRGEAPQPHRREARRARPGERCRLLINGLKREELIAMNSMILHELFFDGLGEQS